MTREERINELELVITQLASGGVKQAQLGSHSVTFYDLAALRAELEALRAEQAAQDAAVRGLLPGFTAAVFDRR